MANAFYNQPNGMPAPSPTYQPVYTVPGYTNGYDNTTMQQSSRPQLPNVNSQQQPQPAPLPGKVVNDINEVKPNEVPMDGSISLFPLNDFSAIYAKQWAANGLINTLKYIPDSTQASGQSTQNDISAIILERLDNIEKKLDYKPYRKPYNKNHNKNHANPEPSKEENE